MKTSKYSDCSSCPLYTQSRCIGETNSQDDLSKIELLVLAEAPASEEIKQNRPLIGRSGQVFREAFTLSGLDQTKYMISNVVLCANLSEDGKTSNPPVEAVEKCKPNWQALIEFIKPKVILIMGSIPMQAFGIAEGAITTKRGNFYKYGNIPVMLTIHPSYVMRQPGVLKSDAGQNFINDMREVSKFLSGSLGDDEDEETNEEVVVSDKSEIEPARYETKTTAEAIVIGKQESPYSFSLPNWCYAEDVTLFDVQIIYSDNSALYTFLTPNGKKYHKTDAKENYFYVGKESDIEDAPMIAPIASVDLVMGPAEQYPVVATYEGDVKAEVKRSIDYRYNRETEEPTFPLVKMFADIEVYSARSRRFPDPKKAESPINAISFKIGDGPVNVWVNRLPQMDKKPPIIPENVQYKSYANEYNLLQSFAKMVRDTNPHILAGWNWLGFDMTTIYGRMLKLGVDPGLMSPVGNTYIDLKRYGRIFVYGLHTLDLLDLYKELTYSVEESYKLDFIGQKHLGIGKVSYDGTLDELFEENLSEFIRYSAVDTDILYKLDKKMGHIDLKYELVRICGTTWKAAETTMGLVDPLCVSYAKKQNLVCRNAVIHASTESIPGAYVRNPVPGRHNYVIDLDFASLYPSIICSCNIGPNTYLAKIDPDIAHDILYNRNKLNSNMEIDIVLNPLKKSCVQKKIKIKQLLDTLDTKNSILTAAGTIYKNHTDEVSFLNKILSYLLDSRKEYKGSMKTAKRNNDDSLFKRYHNMQLSYKILANSIYGVLANNAFRFFNNDMAKSITLTGQELVKFSGWHLGQFMKTGKTDINPDFLNGYEDSKIPFLLYQDTDSLFIAMGDYLAEQKKI